MANLAPIGVQAVADASVSDLLAHWIAECQGQRTFGSYTFLVRPWKNWTNLLHSAHHN